MIQFKFSNEEFMVKNGQQVKTNEKKNEPSRFTYLYEQAMMQTTKKKQFEQEIKQQIEKDEQVQCTFNPKTTNKYKQNMNQTDVVTRNNNWLQAKEIKLSNYKNYLDEVKLQECSFKPQTNNQITKDNDFSQDLYMNRGTANHLMRQISAQKQKQPQQKKIIKKSHVTIPQEFNIKKNKDQINQIKVQNFIVYDENKQNNQMTDEEYRSAQQDFRQQLRDLRF